MALAPPRMMIVAIAMTGSLTRDHGGRSSALRSKVRPRSGMRAPWNMVAGIPSAGRSPFGGPSANAPGRPLSPRARGTQCRCATFTLIAVDDFHVPCNAFLTYEARAPLVIDADAPLALAIALEPNAGSSMTAFCIRVVILA
jgi:hypothetical protein